MGKGKKFVWFEVVVFWLSCEEVEDVVCVLLCWVGDDFVCEGLLDIFVCVVCVYEQFFVGYVFDLCDIFVCMFSEVDGYDEMIVLKDICFESYCEYYMVLIIGCVYVVYLLNYCVVGILKFVCFVDVFVKCLQIQEKMIVQIVDMLFDVLQLKGVGVIFEVVYQCIFMCGVYKLGVEMVMLCMFGMFCIDLLMCCEFLLIVVNFFLVNLMNI